jgi:hypothetical protein
MKRQYKILAGLLIAGTVVGAAFAQGRGGCDGMGPMGMQGGQNGPMGRHAAMKFDPAQRAERHLDMLKAEIKPTPAQEPLWQAFAEKSKEQAGKGLQAFKNQQADTKLTAPERMAQMQTMLEGRLAAMKDVSDSFNRLYAALSPEQKQAADRYAARMGHGGMAERQRGPGRGPGAPAAGTASQG